MKKIMITILALSLSLTLVGCNNEDILLKSLEEDNFESDSSFRILLETSDSDNELTEDEKVAVALLEKGVKVYTEAHSKENLKTTIKVLGFDDLLTYLKADKEKYKDLEDFTVELIRNEDKGYLRFNGLDNYIEIEMPEEISTELVMSLMPSVDLSKNITIDNNAIEVKLSKEDVVKIVLSYIDMIKESNLIETATKEAIDELDKELGEELSDEMIVEIETGIEEGKFFILDVISSSLNELLENEKINIEVLVKIELDEEKNISSTNFSATISDDITKMTILSDDIYSNYGKVEKIEAPTKVIPEEDVDKEVAKTSLYKLINGEPKTGIFNIEKDIAIINNKIVKLNNKPLNIKGNTLVPIRNITDVLEVEPIWNAEEKNVYIYNKGVELLLYYETGVTMISKGVEDIQVVDALVFNSDGTVYVPLRFVTESLGGIVEWNPDTKDITITFN